MYRVSVSSIDVCVDEGVVRFAEKRFSIALSVELRLTPGGSSADTLNVATVAMSSCDTLCAVVCDTVVSVYFQLHSLFL